MKQDASPVPMPADERPRRVMILGARVDDVTWDETLTRIDTFLRSGEPHQIMTPNPEFVMRARHDKAFRELLNRVDLAPADGIGLKWAARLIGDRIRELVPGSDLVPRLAERGARQGQRWFLLGAADGVAEEAGAVLVARYPGLLIAGCYAGSPRPEHDDEICRLIEAAKPIDILLVAYGAPGQDLWIARNQPRLRVPVAIGVGGTFNFIAGRSRRAPQIVRQLNLIWLFRLITEPWRWRRQLALIPFVGHVVRDAALRRVRHATGTRSI